MTIAEQYIADNLTAAGFSPKGSYTKAEAAVALAVSGRTIERAVISWEPHPDDPTRPRRETWLNAMTTPGGHMRIAHAELVRYATMNQYWRRTNSVDERQLGLF